MLFLFLAACSKQIHPEPVPAVHEPAEDATETEPDATANTDVDAPEEGAERAIAASAVLVSIDRAALSRPRVKLITDRSGQVFAKPKEIDLGVPSQGRRFPRITGVIEPSKARFNVTSVLMSDVTSGSQVQAAP